MVPRVPLQIPGGPELLIVLLIGLILLVVPLAAAYWVYQDATSRDNDDSLAWTVATLAGGIVGSLVGLALVLVLYVTVGRE